MTELLVVVSEADDGAPTGPRQPPVDTTSTASATRSTLGIFTWNTHFKIEMYCFEFTAGYWSVD